MTRTAIRHTLSALGALTLAAVVVSCPASAGHHNKEGCYAGGQCLNPIIFDHSALITQGIGANTNVPKALASPNPPQRGTTTHYPIRWWHDYGN